jgi:hypothetical protein
MADKLYHIGEVDISPTSDASFAFVVAAVYSMVRITAVSLKGDADVDLYISRNAIPTIWQFDYVGALNGSDETLDIPNPSQDRYSGIAHAFSGSGTYEITVWGMLSPEAEPITPIDDTNGIINGDLTGTVGEITGHSGSVNIVINQDTRAIAEAIIGMKADIEDAITSSISKQADAIKTSLSGISDLHSTEMNGVTEGLKSSYNNSAKLINTSVSELGDSIDYSVGNLGYMIKDSLLDSANLIDTKLANPLMLALTDLSDNIKAISHNTIDDILMSIFEKVQE